MYGFMWYGERKGAEYGLKVGGGMGGAGILAPLVFTAAVAASALSVAKLMSAAAPVCCCSVGYPPP